MSRLRKESTRYWFKWSTDSKFCHDDNTCLSSWPNLSQHSRQFRMRRTWLWARCSRLVFCARRSALPDIRRSTFWLHGNLSLPTCRLERSELGLIQSRSATQAILVYFQVHKPTHHFVKLNSESSTQLDFREKWTAITISHFWVIDNQLIIFDWNWRIILPHLFLAILT